MTAGFLTYETGWREVSFNIKIEKMEEDEISRRNSKFNCDHNEFKVKITFNCSTSSWINGSGAQRRDVH